MPFHNFLFPLVLNSSFVCFLDVFILVSLLLLWNLPVMCQLTSWYLSMEHKFCSVFAKTIEIISVIYVNKTFIGV